MTTWKRKKISSPQVEVDDFDGGLDPDDAIVTIRWSDGKSSYEMVSSPGHDGRSAEFYTDGKHIANGLGPVTKLEGWETLYGVTRSGVTPQQFADVTRFARDASKLTTDALKRLKNIRR